MRVQYVCSEDFYLFCVKEQVFLPAIFSRQMYAKWWEIFKKVLSEKIITLLVSHEPFIGKFLNIVPGYNIEEWPDMANV